MHTPVDWLNRSPLRAPESNCMVALPGQLFYSAQIPACLWFLARGRKRRGAVLFIDARKLRIAEAVHNDPDGTVRDVVFPVASEETITNLVKESHSNGPQYQVRVYTKMRASYSAHYRKMLPHILEALYFQSNNKAHRPKPAPGAVAWVDTDTETITCKDNMLGGSKLFHRGVPPTVRTCLTFK